ncbi:MULTISPECIES: hypothetical protein [Raoultella]|uniref:hypothetical protein n=1 Tax=Raoultella TaxID=160674 RepID=UPI001E36540F|nr:MULTISPECIES: hypothetical protein [Raoultella]MCC2035037.1 hypothetical protein [Raoultella ornithinolytica]MCC2041594.1 hypothetical protein [Raoultella ornithinolytica]MCC2046569.1 hypothetical protein [Raoultella ornithinolytica]MCC2052274.1 hypothetical protein [Raoultella ornithinolytica]MCC2056621.1 hypothetical protein [Raoultella ornithinolytica]
MTSKLTREQLIKKAQEQIAFCRHTKITGEGLAHVNQCAALFEIALAAMDSEPVAWLAIYHGEVYDEAIGITRSVVEAEVDRFGWEYGLTEIIPLYRHAQPAPVVPDGLLSMAASAIEDLLEHTDPNTSYYSGVWADVPGKLRAAMLQAGNCRENASSSTNNCREIAETSTNRSREHFISLCNEFWNWSEMDLVCADDRGYELRMEWDGKVFNHPVTQALWRMYQAAPGNSPVIPGGLIGAVNRLLDSDGSRGCYSAIRCGDAHDEIERLLAAVPQEVKP